MNTVIFDFDGTLTKRDTLRPFANSIAKRERNYLNLFAFYILLIAYKLGLVADKKLKELFMNLFISGKSVDEVESIVKAFLEENLKGLINKEIYDKLKQHVASGDEVYIASANFDFLLNPLIDRWSLRGIISTETEKTGNHFTCKIIENTCKGIDKVKKIKTVLGPDKLKNAIAYGDSEDSCLLKYAGHGVKVS